MRHPSTALLALLLALPAAARVVSYAPVTDRVATPVQQPRSSSEFVLIEAKEGGFAGPVGGPVADALPWYGWLTGRLVVHDATGAREARVVLPTGGPEAAFHVAAARPGPDGALRILALTTADPAGLAARDRVRLLYSKDGGASWMDLAIPSGLSPAVPVNWIGVWQGVDFGGPVTRGRDPVVRLGSAAAPFFLLLSGTARDGSGALVAVDDAGALRVLAEFPGWEADGSGGARLVGTDRDGSAVLAAGRLRAPGAAGPAKPPQALCKVGEGSGVEKLLDLPQMVPGLEGWLASGGAYVEVAAWTGSALPPPFSSTRGLYFVSGGEAREVAAPDLALRGPDGRLRGGLGPSARSRKADRPREARARGGPRGNVERSDGPRGRGAPRRRLREEAPRPGPSSASAARRAPLQGPGARTLGGGTAGPAGPGRALPERAVDEGFRPPRRRAPRRRRAVRLRLRLGRALLLRRRRPLR